MHWTKRGLRDPELTEMALTFVRKLLDAPIPYVALENPVSVISSRIRKPDQIIQPYDFGHDASKATCLWLKGLPKLIQTQHVEPRIVGGKKRWANQTDSGQNKLAPSKDRWKLRSTTYQGIAEAMAAQWSAHIEMVLHTGKPCVAMVEQIIEPMQSELLLGTDGCTAQGVCTRELFEVTA